MPQKTTELFYQCGANLFEKKVGKLKLIPALPICIFSSLVLVALLKDTVKKSKEDKLKDVIVYWDGETQCRTGNFSQDNVTNLFIPKLEEVKKSMRKLLKDKEDSFDRQVNWITAKLCDGDDQPTEELSSILGEEGDDNSDAIQIKSQVENIVLALHRVRFFQSRMAEIFQVSAE